MKIHAQFTWAPNRQAIRISNQFITDGKAAPYIDGLYAWDPQDHVIVFWYVDAKGALSKGTVKAEEGKLVHQFRETQLDGKTADEILSRKENRLTPLVHVRYEIAE